MGMSDRLGNPEWYARMRKELEREEREYERAVAALSPALRSRWGDVLRDNEYFDGENGIALGVLRRMKADGTLRSYRSRYPEY